MQTTYFDKPDFYNFIPAKITLGRFDSNKVFVTCRYNYQSWCNVSIFERLCGYKPHKQKNPVKQLTKIVSSAVCEIDNLPVSGFEFVDFDNDLYSLEYKQDKVKDIVLRDPRGFCVAISNANFWYMMACTKSNLENGKFNHNFVYAWSGDYGRFMIVDAETDRFKTVLDNSEKLKDRQQDKKSHITKSKLSVGTIYSIEPLKYKCMYLGEMPIYDSGYHLHALECGEYIDLKEYKCTHMYSDLTSADRCVFYVIADDYSSVGYPFLFLAPSSISSKVESVAELDLSTYTMFNDNTKQLSLETVQEYMTNSLIFNRIDLKSFSKYAVKECPKPLFKNIVDYVCSYASEPLYLRTLPFKYYSSPFSFVSKGSIRRCYGYCLEFKANNLCSSTPELLLSDACSHSMFGPDIKHHFTAQEFKNIDYMYEQLHPMLVTGKLENGNDISDEYMSVLQSDFFSSKWYTNYKNVI